MSTSFKSACGSDPLLNILIPPSSLLVSYRKLPNLMRLLCSPDQNKFISNSSPSGVSGYLNTGCRCMVCKISTFGRYASPPSMPGYKVPITSTVSCVSGPAVVYHLVCRSGRPECRKAHYVGMASTSKSNVKQVEQPQSPPQSRQKHLSDGGTSVNLPQEWRCSEVCDHHNIGGLSRPSCCQGERNYLDIQFVCILSHWTE